MADNIPDTILWYAFTEDKQLVDDPTVPGICSICGAMVPGPNVAFLSADELTTPAYLHIDYHRGRGELR